MKLFPPIRELSSKSWFLLIGAILWSFLIFQFHYYFEIIIVLKNSAPYYFVIFHYLGVPFGAIISIKLPRNLFFKIITGSGLIIFSFITLLISNEIWLIPVGYFLAGMAIGLSVSAGFFYIFPVFKNKRYSGRFFNLGVSMIFALIFLESLLNFILIPFLGVLFFIILFVLVILFLLIGDRKKDSLDTYILENSNIKTFLKNRNNLSVIAFTFILGFFWVNNYYAGVLILDNSGLIDSFGTFIASTFLGALIFAFPAGILADFIGRRFTILIGMAIQSIALIIPSFVSNQDIIILFFFPFFIGIGLSMILGIGMAVMFESAHPKSFEYSINIYFLVFTPGMFMSVIIVEILKPFFLINPATLTIIMLLILILATIIVFQLKETLPSKEELEWKDSIQYLYVIRKSGVPIFTYNFNEKRESEEKLHDTLLSGVLTAISTASKRIAREESPLKQVEHANFTIILEEGEEIFIALVSKKDLNILRSKLCDFLDEFHQMFNELLKTETNDGLVFSPAKSLIQKHFS